MLVDRLADAGWVRRRPHPNDRRAVLLELAAEGPESIPTGLAEYHARIAALTSAIPPKQREPIRTFLEAAAEAAARATRELCRHHASK